MVLQATLSLKYAKAHLIVLWQIVLMRIVCDLSSEGANHLNEKQAANDEGVKSRESPVISLALSPQQAKAEHISYMMFCQMEFVWAVKGKS